MWIVQIALRAAKSHDAELAGGKGAEWSRTGEGAREQARRLTPSGKRLFDQ